MNGNLSADIFAARRALLLQQLPPNSAVVLFAPGEARRNNDVHYPFRQESYFWYFTGFPEAEAVAVFTTRNGASHYTLYSYERDPLREIWEGKIVGQEGAQRDYGVNEALPLRRLDGLAASLADINHLYTLCGDSPTDDRRASALLRQIHQLNGRGGASIDGIGDVRQLAAEMRLRKGPEELALMREATRISALGHRAAMLRAGTAKNEYQIQAAVENGFREEGCDWSFPSIIAGGANACCLHYRENNAPLRAGDLLLVDAGAELGGYAGDLTRTFPINGKFSREQQALYEIVLAAQKTGIANAKAGIRHTELHDSVATVIIQGLLDLKIISGSVSDWFADNRYKQFYPHGTGHWLGLDVHDVGIYKVEGQSRRYEEGMVITVEPGIYIQTYDDSVAPQWRGIGIRIEDDVLVTAAGGEVLDASVAPKEVADIEALLRS